MHALDILQGLPVKKLAPSTQAESPAFALKRRRLNNNNSTTESESEGKEETSDDRVIRANPMPNMDKMFQPQLPHKKVETKPFSFEERDKNKPNRETLVEMILRKEKVRLCMYVYICKLVNLVHIMFVKGTFS